MDTLYLNFAKAFHKVPHQRLVTKIKNMEFLVILSTGLYLGFRMETARSAKRF